MLHLYMSRTLKILIVLAVIVVLWKVVSPGSASSAEIEYEPTE